MVAHGGAGPIAKCNYSEQDERGRTLHREFVGMVFALAIAEVAIQGALVVNSPKSWTECIPAYSHLILATLVIAASWVGWGRSKNSESNILTIFSRDFVELLVDLWLVAVYFFIVKGVDVVTKDGALDAIQPSLENEKRWLMVAFVTYLIWDAVTKWGTDDVRQRVWASALCAIFGIAAWWYLPEGTIEPQRVVLGDLSLAVLVILFRAMKMRNISELTNFDCGRILILGIVFGLGLFTTADYDQLKNWREPATPVNIQGAPVQ